ncbi:MAG: hypothetical protein ACERKD_19515 [Prolixibacteraceae bacterium]
MKYFISILIAFLTLNHLGFAQNYQPVFSNRTLCFTANKNDGEFYFVHSDSVRIQNEDSIFYLNKILDSKIEDPWCLSPFSNSVLGDKVILTNKDEAIFISHSDTLTILFKAQKGEEWIMASNDKYDYIAKVKSIYKETFINTTDSVKIIEVAKFDKKFQNPTSTYEQFMVISKNYGIIRTYKISFFPTSDWYLELAGIDHPKIGIQDLKWKDVHNYNVGDEIQTLTLSTRLGVFLSKRVFTEKRTINDSIHYSYTEKIFDIDDLTSNDRKLTLRNETQHQMIVYENVEFDRISGEPVIVDDYAAKCNILENNFFLKKGIPSCGMAFNHGESCWEPPFETFGCYTEYYYKGLGGPYYYVDNRESYAPYTEDVQLNYYRKGDTTMGNDWVALYSDKNDYTNKLKLQIINGKVRINGLPKSNYAYKLDVFNLAGQRLKRCIISDQVTIDLSEFNSQQLVYKITCNEKVIDVGHL